MKVHRFGNDYAYQLKQKREAAKVESENANNQVQSAGEGTVATTENTEPETESTGNTDEPKTTAKTTKKKKKEEA
jgi:hypothetical protein